MIMKSISILIVTALYLALFNSHGVRAEVDTCVECHKNPEFQVSYIRLYNYYKDWEGSAHELGGVSCVDCHLGDSTATVKEKAHHVANSYANPDSTTYYKNVPETCGQCHNDVVRHFLVSKHYRKFQEGEGPNCVTCHGSMANTIPNIEIIEEVCMHCHNDTKAPSAVIPQAQVALSWLNLVRSYLGWSEINPQPRPTTGEVAEFELAYRQVANAWHRFDLAATTDAADHLLTVAKCATVIRELNVVEKTFLESEKIKEKYSAQQQ
jgi:hypothetical protein